MFLLSNEDKRLVSFETLLAQAMTVAPAAPDESYTTLTEHYPQFSPPMYEEGGSDDEGYSIMEL